MKLTLKKLMDEAITFSKIESKKVHNDLVGITDGKTVGTYIERKFKNYLKNKYDITLGSSAKGIDLPDQDINTDIKVTSIKRPQSSSPFKNIEQKIYGLGHNLLIFVYNKKDINNSCYIEFKHCFLIKSERTGDYNITKSLIKMLEDGTTKVEIVEFLKEKHVPGSDEVLNNLAQKILTKPPKQGYLTISNALQWRLKYSNAINLKNEINGVYNYDK